MSRYSDKRRQPYCRVDGCSAPAVELRIRLGILGWYCPTHRDDQK